MIWAPGDEVVLYTGNYQAVSSKTWQPQGQYRGGRDAITYTSFIFDMGNRNMELQIASVANLPNGPTLLIATRRSETIAALGLVSMVNGAWTYCWPLDEQFHFLRSERMAKMIEKSTGGGIIGLAFRNRIKAYCSGSDDGMMYLPRSAEVNEIESVLKRFMYRISSNAQSYWPSSSRPGMGKL